MTGSAEPLCSLSCSPWKCTHAGRCPPRWRGNADKGFLPVTEFRHPKFPPVSGPTCFFHHPRRPEPQTLSCARLPRLSALKDPIAGTQCGPRITFTVAELPEAAQICRQ